MTIYYHVSQDWQEGDDLLCFDEVYAQTGTQPSWKWEEEPFDTHLVCLFKTLKEAEDMKTEWLPNGRILQVNLPDNPEEWGMMVTENDEGFTCVIGRIPAEYIRIYSGTSFF